MSWLFSRALVEASLGGSFSDGTQSAPSSSHPTPQAYCAPDKMTDFSRPSRFGMTFAPLTEVPGGDVLTWCLADSLARTSARPGKVPESTAREVDCGQRWQESSVRFDPSTHSWKTHRTLFDSDLPECSVTLPAWGMTLGGVVFQRAPLVRHKPGRGSGLLPTLTASDAKGARNGTAKGRTPASGLTMTDWLWLNIGQGMLHPESAEWMMLWPVGWTELQPSATDKCRRALPLLGESLEAA